MVTGKYIEHLNAPWYLDTYIGLPAPSGWILLEQHKDNTDPRWISGRCHILLTLQDMRWLCHSRQQVSGGCIMTGTRATWWWLPLGERGSHTHRGNHWHCAFLSFPISLSRDQEPQTCFPRKLWAESHISSYLICSLVPAMWAGILWWGSMPCQDPRVGKWEGASTAILRSSPL